MQGRRLRGDRDRLLTGAPGRAPAPYPPPCNPERMNRSRARTVPYLNDRRHQNSSRDRSAIPHSSRNQSYQCRADTPGTQNCWHACQWRRTPAATCCVGPSCASCPGPAASSLRRGDPRDNGQPGAHPLRKLHDSGNYALVGAGQRSHDRHGTALPRRQTVDASPPRHRRREMPGGISYASPAMPAWTR